jgi:heme exporter protein D
MDLGPHAFFILAAYGAAALVVLGLVARAVLDHRAQVRALASLEARGARRRSVETPAGTPGGIGDEPAGKAAEIAR